MVRFPEEWRKHRTPILVTQDGGEQNNRPGKIETFEHRRQRLGTRSIVGDVEDPRLAPEVLYLSASWPADVRDPLQKVFPGG